MKDETVTILSNRKINEKYYKLIFRSKTLSKKVLPGQFMMVQINEELDPFLRRPFSYYRISGDQIEILYEVLGRGTAIFSRKGIGESLNVFGPLGKSFRLKVPQKMKRVLVAGGVGVPPLVFLAEKYPSDFFLIGTKSRSEVLPKKETTKVSGKVFYSTNDGSYGVKGYVTVLLEKLIREEGAKNLFLQTCGPNVMMEAVMKIAKREGIEGEASVDKTMACGVGACLGCMVKTVDGWKPSCVEGPVFNFSELIEI